MSFADFGTRRRFSSTNHEQLIQNFFLSTFDTFYAKLFDGVRQDSGDPFGFTLSKPV